MKKRVVYLLDYVHTGSWRRVAEHGYEPPRRVRQATLDFTSYLFLMLNT